jgi:hypothetical protein
MRSAKCFLGVLIFLGILVIATSSAQTASLAGTWIGKLEIPNLGSSDITLVLKATKSVYTGTLTDSAGWWAKEAEISEVKIDGNNLSFSTTTVEGSMVIIFRLTAAGDKMAGECENTAVAASVPIEFLKKK